MGIASVQQDTGPEGPGARRAPSLADWVWAGAAAAGFLPVTLIEAIGAARPADAGGWLGAALTLFALLHLGVAFRRRSPRLALAGASAVMLALTALSLPGSPTVVVLLPSSLCYLVLVFTAATSDDRIADLAALVVGLAGAALITTVAAAHELATASGAGPGEIIALGGFLVASIGAAWALGRYRRESRRKLAAQALGREQAAELQLERERAAVAEERRRIGGELHDVISHSLAVMVAQAEAARLLHGRDDGRSLAAVEHVVATGRSAMTDMRRLLGVLAEEGGGGDRAPLPLEPSPGLDDVPDLVSRVSGPDRAVGFRESGSARPIAPGVGLTAYRVIQESLTNTLKHTSPPTRNDIHVAWRDRDLVVTIEDDGGSAAPQGRPAPVVTAPVAGRGIAGMRERVERSGGRLDSGPSEGGHGWRTRAILPLMSAEPPAEQADG